MEEQNVQNKVFPVTHSLPSSKALMAEVSRHWDVGSAFECKLLNIGLNDTYQIRNMVERLIVRVYRTGFRTEPDISYELELLKYLADNGVSVSPAIPTRDGEMYVPINAPEGMRYLAVFPYAKGHSMSMEKDDARAYGRTVGVIHKVADGFNSKHTRFVLDLEYLINRQLKAITPLLRHRKDDIEFLNWAADEIWDRLNRLSLQKLDWGPCHGDLHGGNAHITRDGKPTFYDFDSGGPGYRAYDLGVFLWESKDNDGGSDAWDAFKSGYNETRGLSERDWKAVPLFAAVRSFWKMGLQCANSDDWGYSLVDERYFDEELGALEDWIGRAFR